MKIALGAALPLEKRADLFAQYFACPKDIPVDQGSEFISRDLDLWPYQRDVILDFSRPGKLTDNSFIESFNGKLRAECLNTHWFMSLDDAQLKLEDWRRDYNEVRPHSAICNKAPITLLNGSLAPPPACALTPVPAAAGLVFGCTSKPEQTLLINDGKQGSRSW